MSGQDLTRQEIDLKKIPGAFLKIFIYILLGIIVGTLGGYIVYWLLVKLSLLSTAYWLFYFLPAGGLSGFAGGIIWGVTAFIKGIVIESGILATTTKSVIGVIFRGIDTFSDSDKATGKVFELADSQIEKIRQKGERIKQRKGFFLIKFFKYKTYFIVAKVLESALESPNVRETPLSNRERFIAVFNKAVTFYAEEYIDDLLWTPFLVWIFITLLLILIPIIIGLIF